MVDCQDNFNYTPLHYAAVEGHATAARLLLSLGADRTIKEMNGETAKDIAKDENRIRQGPNKQHAANTSDISLTAIYSYSLLSVTSPGGPVTQACVQVLGSTSLRPERARGRWPPCTLTTGSPPPCWRSGAWAVLSTGTRRARSSRLKGHQTSLSPPSTICHQAWRSSDPGMFPGVKKYQPATRKVP